MALQMANLNSDGDGMSLAERMRHASSVFTHTPSYPSAENIGGHRLNVASRGTGGPEEPLYVDEPSWAVRTYKLGPRNREMQKASTGATSWGDSHVSTSWGGDSQNERRESLGSAVSGVSSWKTASKWNSPYGLANPKGIGHHLVVGPNGDPLWPGRGCEEDHVGRPSQGPYFHDAGMSTSTPPPGSAPSAGFRQRLDSKQRAQDDHFPHNRPRKSFPSMIPEQSMEKEQKGSRGSSKDTANEEEGPPSTMGVTASSRPSAARQKLEENADGTSPEDNNTTLMMKHIPKAYSRDRLCVLLDKFSLSGMYDFVYLPVKFSTNSSFGYAFLNFRTVPSARQCHLMFDGFTGWDGGCEEPCEVSMKTKHQGLAACIELYRNSPVMHPSVDESVKPAVFEHGVRVPFPPPSKTIKAPRARAPAEEGTADGDGA
mmetsp:Transcript_145100/g.465019  ORF Transcript_145100/g.465019 Transcript_145100/m.465019 type:complete len:429 (-) Transcript_145100:193-1479(-)